MRVEYSTREKKKAHSLEYGEPFSIDGVIYQRARRDLSREGLTVERPDGHILVCTIDGLITSIPSDTEVSPMDAAVQILVKE